MCFIELVDYNENMLKEKATKKATRTRRSKKKAEDAVPAVEAETPATPAEETAPVTSADEKTAE